MDPEEIRQRRRAKVLARSGINAGELEVLKSQEISIKDQQMVMKDLEIYTVIFI